jgi:predicted nucleotidyltransferase component of viral defense system
MLLAENPILNDVQKAFLAQYRHSPLCSAFYLTGGTALSAFYLQHRYSEDLDFFSEAPCPLETILAFLRSLNGVQEVLYELKFDRKMFVLRFADPKVLKVEFTQYPFVRRQLGPVVEGIQVDGLSDILINKLIAMTDRRDAKDYVDLYFAFRMYSELQLDQLILQAESKFGVQGVQSILQGRFLLELPAQGKLFLREPFDVSTAQMFFAAMARRWIQESQADAS